MSRRVVKVRRVSSEEYQVHVYVDGAVSEGADVRGPDAARRAYRIARRMRGKGGEVRWMLGKKRR